MNGCIVRGLAAASLTVALGASAAELETDAQKLGYMIGMDVGQSLRQQGMDIDVDALVEAIRTTYAGEQPAMTAEESQAIREEYLARRQAAVSAEQGALAEKNKAEAEAFLAENAGEEGVVTTETGLQYKVIEQGDGARPAATDTVTVHYRGTLLDGTEFDSSYSRDEPTPFVLNQVIPGFTEGLQLMPVGSKYEFYIMPELGYGEAGGGPIPPSSVLIFEVELLDIEGSE